MNYSLSFSKSSNFGVDFLRSNSRGKLIYNDRIFHTTQFHFSPLQKAYATMTVSGNDVIMADYSPVFRVYEDGRVDHLNVGAPVPPSVDRKTGVESKDKVIFPETGVSVRIFNPINIFQQNGKNPTFKKMAVIMYIHGGGFCSGSTFSPGYHRFLNRLACESRAVVVSVEYRKATEHPLPAAYNDCWDALKWIISHNPDNFGDQPRLLSTKEPWLEPGTVDFSRLYLAGDSSGANVAHQVALRAGTEGLGISKTLEGLILIQPFFWGKDRIGDEVSKCRRYPDGAESADKIWAAARWGSPASVDDPWMNPALDPKLSWLGCQRVMLCLAKEDVLRDRGLLYGYALKKSGWVGDIELLESEGEDHAFQLKKPNSTSSRHLMTKIEGFVNSHSELQFSCRNDMDVNIIKEFRHTLQLY